MKWKYSYFAFATLFLWSVLSSGCGTKKKVVTKTQIDSTYYSKALTKDYQANITTQIISENTTLDLSEFKAVQTDYDTLGRKTRQIVIERREERKTGQKTDSAVKDSSRTKEATSIDSGSVKKEELLKNKDSDTTLMRNIGTRTMIIMFAIAVAAFFLYKYIKR